MLLTLRRQVAATTGSGLTPLSQQLNRMLDNVFTSSSAWRDDTVATSSWVPAVDVIEEDDAIKIVAEVPGVRPEDVTVSFENQVLVIRGEKEQEHTEPSDRVRRYERSYGAFERHFSLPSTVDADKIEAHYDVGVLTVSLPKVERARPREIPVSTQ